MKKKLCLIFANLFLFVGMATAQIKVTGKVVAFDDGEPIMGATVQLKGDNKVGTVTDGGGNFTITVPNRNSILRFTYIGMMPHEEVAKPTMLVRLQDNPNDLNEVIVVAYGTQKKTSLTGSIQEVKSEEIALRPTSSVASALEGMVSGVQVNSTYGSPGDDPSIRIRGVGTVNGSSSPLYVIDGVPYGGNISDLNPADIESMSVLKDAASAALYGNRASNGVILITTKKGKQGRLNVSLDIKQGTYSRGIKEYDRVNAIEFMGVEWQNLKNYRMSNKNEDLATAMAYASSKLVDDRLYVNPFDVADEELFDADGHFNSNAHMRSGYLDDLDWYDQALRHGYRQEYNVSANGANERADYLFSLGYLDENGYLKNSGFDRLSARVSANVQPKKWLKLGMNLSATHQNFNNTNGNSDGGYTNAFMYCRNIAPIYPVHLHDVTTGEYILDKYGNKQYDPGYYTDASGNEQDTRGQYVDRHVIWENELNYDKTVRNTLNGIAYADIILPYNFTFTLKGNLNVRNNNNYTYNSAIIGDGKGNHGRAKRVDTRYKNYTFQQQLHWNHEYGVHSLDALLAHENYYYTYNYMYGYKTNEALEGKGYMRNFTDISSLYDYNDNYRTESYLGRVRYGYDNRYNAEFSFRRDGSSRFEKSHRWGNFWSVGANWVISNEGFMKKYDWVDYLKLRADYGEVGNDAGAGYYGYMSLFQSNQNANNGAYYVSQYPNEDLKWETGQSWGVAIDARLFNRWNFSIEYFDKRNKDLLFDVYHPLSAGATTTSSAQSVTTMNIGTISNRGLEISTDVDIIRNKDWKVNVGTEFTLLKNKVTKLPEQNKDGIIDGTKKIMEGKDRYAFFVYTFEGIDSYNGNSLYKFNDDEYYFEENGVTYGNDKNGSKITGSNLDLVTVIDGVPYSYRTTYAKKEYHGSAIPDVYGSFHFSVSWKSLSLSTLFTYQLGGKVMDYNYQSLMQTGSSPHSYHKDILNSWTTDQQTVDADGNPIHQLIAGGTPRQDYNLSSYNNATSSRWLTNASYLVLKNLTLSYQLPKNLVHKIDLDGIGLTLSFENLFTCTKRLGMNPQQSFSGTQYNYLVTPRVISMGINVKF